LRTPVIKELERGARVALKTSTRDHPCMRKGKTVIVARAESGAYLVILDCGHPVDVVRTDLVRSGTLKCTWCGVTHPQDELAKAAWLPNYGPLCEKCREGVMAQQRNGSNGKRSKIAR